VSDSENPSDIVEAPGESPESNLVGLPPAPLPSLTISSIEDALLVPSQSDSENPNDIIEASNESPQSNHAGSPPAPLPSITISSIEHVLPSQSDSEILNDIVEAPNEFLESNLAGSLPAPPPSITISSIEHVLPSQSDSENRDDIVESLYESSESNLNISQVSLLIRSAQIPGNESALNQIKTFIRNALRTAPKKQTPEQRFALALLDSASVRSRRSSTFSLHSIVYLPSQLAQSSSSSLSPLKIFVDASEHGIGFILNDRWLAWTFTHNIPRGSNKKIIMSWAELIAVELGILTLLAGGYRDSQVLVKSDNRGVVAALTKKKWKPKYDLDIILARILRLCEEAPLELKAQWLWGKKNLADGPSRGQYPPADLMLDYTPRIPQHLEELVNQIAGASASRN
jgi:hypothetical protein